MAYNWLSLVLDFLKGKGYAVEKCGCNKEEDL
jgi:hypothetical protein